MTTDTELEAIKAEPMENLALVALTPAEMAPAQQSLSAWCSRKIAALEAEFKEFEQHHAIASANGWKLTSVDAALNRTAKRETYYRKMKAAVDAGYLIIPNLPVNLLAVRVRRVKQAEAVKDYKYASWDARAEVLPAGEGRYVDDTVLYRDESYKEIQDGKPVTVKRFVSDDYDDVDFPNIVAVKPQVLDATARAMALKVFDEIGLVQNNAGRDPIVVGRLIDPRGKEHRSTFFIAWWLNTADL